jgi:hypothetical protein
MRRALLTASGLLLVFVVLGSGWVGIVHLLPEGAPRTAFMLLLGVGFVGGFVALLALRLREIMGGTRRLAIDLALLGFQLSALILAFAAVYQQVGLLDNTGAQPETVHDFWTSVYYSVVTFTTLGYGDFYPVGSGRALAALQAFTGYVVLGMVASTAASMISPNSRAGRAEDG